MEKPKGHPLKDAIQRENQARQAEYDADAAARTKVIIDSLKDLGSLLKKEAGRFLSEVGETLKDKWNQGRDELGKALMHGQDGFMPWPEHEKQEAPKIEPPEPYRPKPVPTEKPKPLSM